MAQFSEVREGLIVMNKWMMLAAAVSIAATGFAGMAYDLTTEGEKSPVGLDVSKPRFSWKMKPEAGKKAQMQTAYRLVLKEAGAGGDTVFDSGKVESDASVLVDPLKTDLKPRTDYVWTVQLWDETGTAGKVSEPAPFDTGYFSQEEWTQDGAMWIDSVWPVRSNEATELWTKVAIANIAEAVEMIGYKDRVDPKDIQDYKDRRKRQLDEEVWPGNLFRKEFDASKVVKARLYICGLGYYRAYLNGERIGDRDLSPSDSNIRVNTYYNIYDVTEQLRDGGNCLGVEVVNGRWRSWPGITTENFHGQPFMIARLEMTDANGQVKTVVSDDSWKTGEHGIIKSSFWIGEVFDANVHPEGWSNVGFDDSAWEPARKAKFRHKLGVLERDPMPAEKNVAYHEPVKVTEPMPKVYVVDFGKQIVGRSKITFRGLKKGQKIAIRYSEVLPGDLTYDVAYTLGYYPSFDNTNQIPGMLQFKRRGSVSMDVRLPSTDSNGKKGWVAGYHIAGGALYTDMFVSAGKPVEVFEPNFTYVGFRYFEILGLEGKPKAGDVLATSIRTDSEVLGTLTTSSEKLNRVLKGTQMSLLMNNHSQYQDNPGGERNAFLCNEGFNVENSTFWVNFHPQLTKVLNNLIHLYEYYDYYPSIHSGMRHMDWFEKRYFHFSSANSYPNLAGGMISFYNDQRLGKEMAMLLKGWITDLCEKGYWFHDLFKGSGAHQSGESLRIFPRERITSDAGNTIGRPYFKAAILMTSGHKSADLLEKLGYEEDANEIRDVLARFNKRLVAKEIVKVKGKEMPLDIFDPETGLWDPKAFTRMGSDNLTVMGRLEPRKPDEELIRTMADEMDELGYITTGMKTSYELLSTVSQGGYVDAAAKVLLREEYPGVLFSIGLTGAGVTEGWTGEHSLTQVEGLCAVGRWFYSDLVGIKPSLAQPAFRRFELKPHMPSQLSSFDFTFDSPRGEIESRWHEKDGQVSWRIVVPPNAVAEVYVPAKEKIPEQEGVRFLRTDADRLVYEVGSGKYTFTFMKR